MNTNRIRTALAGALLSLALFSPATEAARVVVRVGPPAARVEVRAAAPSHRHVWVDGHWRKVRGGWDWVPGHWR